MSYEIIRSPDFPVIVTTFNADFDASIDLEHIITELRATLSAQTEPVYVILDMTHYNLSLNDLFVGTGVGIRSRDTTEDTQHRHMTIKTIIVSEQNLIQASIKGFERFGLGKNLAITSTLDEALQMVENAA